MLNLISADPQNPEYLAFCIQGLLSHGKSDEARDCIAKLERLEPDSERVRKFRAAAGRPSDVP